jgi:hypothetical protein
MRSPLTSPKWCEHCAAVRRNPTTHDTEACFNKPLTPKTAPMSAPAESAVRKGQPKKKGKPPTGQQDKTTGSTPSKLPKAILHMQTLLDRPPRTED